MNHLVVGLGNVGEHYEHTRHNVGFMVLDALVGDDTWTVDDSFIGAIARERTGKKDVLYLKPHTMMNRSGTAVAKARTKHKVKPEHVIVVHDDVDMPLGKIKIVHGRGTGGHNGVESVRRALKTRDFVRVKVGVSPHTPKGLIKKPRGKEKVLKHLMGTFTKKDDGELKTVLKNAARAVEVIIADGALAAMNQFN